MEELRQYDNGVGIDADWQIANDSLKLHANILVEVQDLWSPEGAWSCLTIGLPMQLQVFQAIGKHNIIDTLTFLRIPVDVVSCIHARIDQWFYLEKLLDDRVSKCASPLE